MEPRELAKSMSGHESRVTELMSGNWWGSLREDQGCPSMSTTWLAIEQGQSKCLLN